jgi:FkbM family methyltransferase
LKTLVQSILRPFGLRLARLQSLQRQDYGAGVLFSTLTRFGFSPRCVLDVGANHGNWTREALKYFPGADYLLVEPQDHLKVHVQDLIDAGHKIQWINAGAADECGIMTFYASERDDSSTFLPQEKHPQKRTTSETAVEVLTLDAIVAKYKVPAPDMIKIDAEGFDLKVIEGATSLIGKTDVFLLEAGVACPFENSVLRVINKMDELGYQLMDITELNRSPKYTVLWLTELAFLRKSCPLLASVDRYE